MGGEQKLKEGDSIAFSCESTNTADLIFFTNQCRAYKAKASDFFDTKASVLGDYIPAKLAMEENEVPVTMLVTKDYSGFVLFAFKNGKVAKVPLVSYETKTNRRKLTGAYSDKEELSEILFLEEDCDIVLTSSSGRMLLVHSGSIPLKTTRTTQGVAVMKLKKGHFVFRMEKYTQGRFKNDKRYRSKTLPTLGALPNGEDAEQLELDL